MIQLKANFKIRSLQNDFTVFDSNDIVLCDEPLGFVCSMRCKMIDGDDDELSLYSGTGDCTSCCGVIAIPFSIESKFSEERVVDMLSAIIANFLAFAEALVTLISVVSFLAVATLFSRLFLLSSLPSDSTDN